MVRKKTKFLLLRGSVILAFTILALRVWYIQVVAGNYYRAQGDTSKIRLEPVAALRGIVYDRNGRQLVWNAPSWDVTIVPHGIPNNRAWRIYRQLSSLLHGQPSPAKIAGIVQQNAWQPYAPAIIKQDVWPQTAMIIMQLHRQLPGVRAEPSTIRQYQQDAQLSLSHILGYTQSITPEAFATEQRLYPREHVEATDQVGAMGIEESLDPYLHGINGTEEVEVDAGERPIRVLRHAHTISGDSVYLTLDWKLQQQVSNDLAAAVHHLGLRKGVAIVENVNSGQILAMASLPSFDNNWFSGGISTKRYDLLLKDPAHPLTDLATEGQYPPGSTYKLITATAALQTHVADVNRTIDDTGSIRLCSVYDASACQTFNGWFAPGLGAVNIVGALAKSSDIYFYTVAGGNPNIDPNMPRVGAARLAFYARLLGLGQPSGIEIPYEASGFVPTPAWYDHLPIGPLRNPGDAWHIGDTYNMAIGQGFNLATPLQMVNLTATIANGGTLYRPRIVQRIVGRVLPRRGALRSTTLLQPFVPNIIRRNFLDPANIALIQTGMHDSVAWPGFVGTSFNVRDSRIDAAGKTGTAEAAPLGRPPHAWWVGYAPFNHPKIAVVVMVPNAGGEGAYVAAPIAHKIFEDYFNLPASPNWVNKVQATLVGSGGGAQ